MHVHWILLKKPFSSSRANSLGVKCRPLPYAMSCTRTGVEARRLEWGREAVVSLTASSEPFGTPLCRNILTKAEDPVQGSGAIPSAYSELSSVISSATFLTTSHPKRKGCVLKFLVQDVLWKLPSANPILKTVALGNRQEEEKLSAGLNPLLAQDKRQSVSLSLAHTHTQRREENLPGAPSITALSLLGRQR